MRQSYGFRMTPESTSPRIQPGATYRVALGQHHNFKARVVRPAALQGWWWCQDNNTGEPIVLPENAMERDEAQDVPNGMGA
jgi:hypothetical protein